MKLLISILLLASAAAAEPSGRVYEIRTYTASEGKLPDLLARFRNHTVKLFARHGMESAGYFVPQDAPGSQNTLVYILAHTSREAANKNWEAFRADPDWVKAKADSEANGKLTTKTVSQFVAATDFSKPAPAGKGRLFELRTYTTPEGKLPDLVARFRESSAGLLAKHGMPGAGYFVPLDAPASRNTLIYILVHPSREAARKNWDAFHADPAFIQSKAASEAKGKSILKIDSVFLVPTDFSPLK